MKSVQISEDLLVLICRYHLLGDESVAPQIQRGLETKLEALKRRELYGKAVKGDETARREYLDRIGMADDFKW